MTGKTKKGRERLAHASAGTSSATMNRAEIERALAGLSKERDDLRRDTMTLDEVVGYLEVSIDTALKLAREGKIDRRSHGRYDRKSVEAFAKALAKERDDTMTRDEVVGYLEVSIDRVLKLAREGKIERRSPGRYDRKSVEAFAKALAKERDDTMTRAEVAACLGWVVKSPSLDLLVKQGKFDRRSRGRFDRKSVEAFVRPLAKERDDLRRDTMTLDEVAGYLDVSIPVVQVLARQGKFDRRSHGRYDRKSVEVFAKALPKERAERGAMTRDEVALYLSLSIQEVSVLAREGKIARRPPGRFDGKSVKAFKKARSKERADLCRDTMTLDEMVGYLNVPRHMVERWAFERQFVKRWHGRYDRESVKAVAKALRDAMTQDEVAAYLNISTGWVVQLESHGKIDRSVGGYTRKSVKAFAKEHGNRGTKTCDEVAGYLGVSIGMVEKWAREGKIARRPDGRFGGKSVKALAKERADLRRDTMTRDEVAGSLDLSITEVSVLVRQGKIERRSPGRYDRKSVKAFAKVLADLRRDTMNRDEAAGYLGVPIGMVPILATQGKIERRSPGRYDTKSVKAFADTDNT